MFCPKCGKQMQEGALFCTSCGGMLDRRPAGGTPEVYASVPLTVDGRKEKAKKWGAGIVIFALLIVIIGGTVVGLILFMNPKRRYERLIDRAEQCCDASDYEEAEELYLKAIGIDPDEPFAYIELAEIYLAEDDTDRAERILEKAIDNTDSKKAEKMLAKLQSPPAEPATVAEAPVSDTPTADAGTAGNSDAPHDAGEIPQQTENDAQAAVTTQKVERYELQWDNGYVVFGRYEQDGDRANGPEPIEWEVLERRSGRLLLISRYILDAMPYDGEGSEYTWKNCSLRRWLNNGFYDTAFDPAEQALIPSVTLSNPDNRYFGTDGGGDTVDKVFVLSVAEIERLYDFNSWYDDRQYGFCQELMTPATQWAKDQGVGTYTITENDFKGYLSEKGYSRNCIGMETGWWWLRSPGDLGDPARGVDYDGDCGWGYVKLAGRDGRGIRPVIYIEE